MIANQYNYCLLFLNQLYVGSDFLIKYDIFVILVDGPMIFADSYILIWIQRLDIIESKKTGNTSLLCHFDQPV